MQGNGKKTLNELGRAYKSAKAPVQLKFKATLLEYSERDSTDYWRGFRDVWQYSETPGKMPSSIMLAAHYLLNVDFQKLNDFAK